MRPNVPPLIDYPSSICAEAGQIKDADRLAQMTDTDNSLCTAFTGFSYDIVCLPIMPVMKASADARKPLELKKFFANTWQNRPLSSALQMMKGAPGEFGIEFFS